MCGVGARFCSEPGQDRLMEAAAAPGSAQSAAKCSNTQCCTCGVTNAG